MCHVDLLSDPFPYESSSDMKNKDDCGLERTNTFEIVNDKKLMQEDSYMPLNDHEMRGNMSVTKSIVDYYHNYKHNIGEDDLMSLCRNNQ